jgi:2-polyprenyl-6-methoxyphenol hydroxylase-like FAD-dependent oxidoreductase
MCRFSPLLKLFLPSYFGSPAHHSPPNLQVGGSLAGLLHGLQLKRNGHNVTILERETVEERSSHNAGITYKAGAEKLLAQLDDTGIVACTITERLHFAWRRWPNVYNNKIRYQSTSWGLLYRLLRANFDGFASGACPNPPPARSGDGKATYLIGKHVNDLSEIEDKVTVHFSDVPTGKTDEIVADLVLGADGIHSTVRDIVKAPVKKEYSGYISWRGTVPEKALSKDTADYFIDGFSFNLMSNTYVICYIIPSDDGKFSPGERLVNWVWYYNVADNSSHMKEIFTATTGRQHNNTVAQGLVDPAVWHRVRDAGVARMAAPFAELIGKTEAPFVTKVNDALCTKARYMNDRVLLVGDALATFRPHVALATEQAANHCLSLEKAMRGEMSMNEWEREVCRNARRIWLLSRLVGVFGQGKTLSLVHYILRYLGLMVKLGLGR